MLKTDGERIGREREGEGRSAMEGRGSIKGQRKDREKQVYEEMKLKGKGIVKNWQK